jgi:hypothetical protein
VRTVHWTAYAIAPVVSPKNPPRIDAGIPSSKTAKHAVAGCTRRPTTRPTVPPTTVAETAPIVAHRRIGGNARRLVIALIVPGLHQTGSGRLGRARARRGAAQNCQ